MKTTILAFCMVLLCSLQTAADTIRCQFDLRCIDTSTCTSSEHQFAVSYTPKTIGREGAQISRAIAKEGDETTNGLMAIKTEHKTFISGDWADGAERKLTVDPYGVARYVVWRNLEPFVTLYSGDCEVFQ